MDYELTEDQINALDLAKIAKTQIEKENAINALSKAFPNKPVGHIRWSDGTVSE